MSIISESENISTITATHYERILRERDDARRQFENLKAAAIHTCHDQCQRPMCVLRRERDEARDAIRKAIKFVEAYEPHSRGVEADQNETLNIMLKALEETK
jgi:hypothetical protein